MSGATAERDGPDGLILQYEGAVSRPFGPPGRPRQMSAAAWNGADIAEPAPAGKQMRACTPCACAPCTVAARCPVKRMVTAGLTPVVETQADLIRRVKDEQVKWKKVIEQVK